MLWEIKARATMAEGTLNTVKALIEKKKHMQEVYKILNLILMLGLSMKKWKENLKQPNYDAVKGC